MYCDSCGKRMQKRYIKGKAKIGKVPVEVEVHAYISSKHDICPPCLVDAVVEASHEI